MDQGTSSWARRSLRLVALALVVCAAAPDAKAWGIEGHRLVARLAYERLSPAARAKIGRILTRDRGQSTAKAFETASTWADDIRGDRKETYGWHFVNIPLGSAGYDAARDCNQENGCIVTAIERARAELRNLQLPRERREEALKFLIHFIGDIHQPLHCVGRLQLDAQGAPVLDKVTGRPRHDLGGNLFPVVFFGRTTTPYEDKEGKPARMQLHYVWDSALLLRRMRAPDAGAKQRHLNFYAARLRPQLRRLSGASALTGSASSWANESLALARDVVYPPAEGAALGEAYAARAYPVIDKQLGRAAIRLAAAIEQDLRSAR